MKKIIIIFLFTLFLSIIFFSIDYVKVFQDFERPIFVIPLELKKDGGSGTFQGFGYRFVIKGNFMPEDEFPGVKFARLYLFNYLIKESIRD